MFTEEQLQYLRDRMRQKLSEKRYSHVLGVEAEAAALAEIYLPDRVSEMRVAALLHDMTKNLSNNEQVYLCRRLRLPLTDEDLDSPQILHGRTAAAVIPMDFPKFVTPDILQAIRVHTTGGEEMSVFDMILFVADFTEPGREYTACRELRRTLWQDLETDRSLRPLRRAVCAELAFTLEYLKREGLPIVSATVRALEAMKEQSESE